MNIAKNIAPDKTDDRRLREPGLGLGVTSGMGVNMEVNMGANVQRRRVPAMGMLALPVFCGDEVEIVDPEGLQVAHVAGFDHRGKSVTGALGSAEATDGSQMARARIGVGRVIGHGGDICRAPAGALQISIPSGWAVKPGPATRYRLSAKRTPCA